MALSKDILDRLLPVDQCDTDPDGPDAKWLGLAGCGLTDLDVDRDREPGAIPARVTEGDPS